MDKLFGLPAHPFLVHIPIILLPLSGIGTIAIVARHRWYVAYRWIVLAVAAVGTLGAVLAASAGEELEGRIVAVEGPQAAASWEHHAELGDTARLVALVYFVLLAAYVVVPWFLERRARHAGDADAQRTTGSGPRWLRPVLAALVLVGAVGSVVTIIQAGHTGSKSVWEDYVSKGGQP